MNLNNLYNMCLENYHETGFKLHPSKLLAMLLLSEKDKYSDIEGDLGKFYNTYKSQIDNKINKVEKDFNFTREQMLNYIFSQTTTSNDFDDDKVWIVYGDTINLLAWSLSYRKDDTSEKCYLEWFDGKNWLEGITDDISKNNRSIKEEMKKYIYSKNNTIKILK